MENDLLFTVINQDAWQTATKNGVFSPETYENDGYIICIPDNELENYINKNYIDAEDLLLVVIDPLRLQVPIKTENIEGIKYPLIYGEITLDAIIDRINIPKSNGDIEISISHFD